MPRYLWSARNAYGSSTALPDPCRIASACTRVMTDDEIARLVDDFVRAAALAQQAGFAFVDIKYCHGYLGHEFLSAVDRPGRYGGSFENRTRFLREIVAGIRAKAPGLDIAVRLSAFDFLPFQRGEGGRGEPVPFRGDSYPYAFGGDGTGLGIDLTEPLAFLDLLTELDIKLVCISAGGATTTLTFCAPLSYRLQTATNRQKTH